MITSRKITSSGDTFEFKLSPLVSAIGTSLTQQQNFGTSLKISSSNYSPIHWAEFFTYGRFRFIVWHDPADARFFSGANFGVSGQKLVEILARKSDPVRKMNTQLMIMDAGTNDMSDGDKEGLLADKLKLLDYYLAQGIPTIVLSVPPRDLSVLNFEANSQSRRETVWVNKKTKESGDARPGTYLLDLTDTVTDKSSADGAPKANMFRDGTHWHPIGAVAVGRLLANLINTILPPVGPRVFGNDDKYHVDHNPTGNLHPNQYCLGTGGSAGTGGTGSVCTSMTVVRASGDATYVASLEAVGDGSQRQVIVFTPGATESVFYFSLSPSDFTHGLAAGSWITSSCVLQIGAFNGWKGVSLYLKDQGTNGLTSYGMEHTSLPLPNEAMNGLLPAQPIQLVAGSTQVRPRLEIRIAATGAGASGTGTLKIEQNELRQVTDPRETVGWR